MTTKTSSYKSAGSKVRVAVATTIVVVGMALPRAAFAWDYSQFPLFWDKGPEPNVVLMVDDSTSMHYQVTSETYQRVKSGSIGFTIRSWYICTGYDNSAKRCTSVFPTSLENLSGESTANPAEQGITIYQEPIGATVPRYVYQGNGYYNEVPGAALCNVHKNPGDVDFYLGKSGDVAVWSGAVTADDIGVLVSSNSVGTGVNDTCVRWKTASTGIPDGVDEYTVLPGDYANFLVTKHALATPGSLDFSDATKYPDADADLNNYFPSVDEKIIPNITRIESARQLSKKLVLENYGTIDGVAKKRMGLFSLDSQKDRACGNGSNPSADKTALLGLVDGLRATELSSPLARTQTAINNYFSGALSPISYRCQKNYAFVLTDGEPDNDSGTLDAAVQSGYDVDAKTSGNDLAGKSFNTPEFGGIWTKQNIITHTVNLGLENDLLKRAPLVNSVSARKSDIVGNKVKVSSHGLATGDYVQVISGAAAFLSNGAYYYAVKIDDDTFKLATTKAKSMTCAAGVATDCIAVTGGAGTMLISTGPGKSYLAQDTDAVAASLLEKTTLINALVAPSGIATNSKTLRADTLVYRSRFNTQDWSGEVAAYLIHQVTGKVNTAGAPVWTTRSTLDTVAERGTLLTWNVDTNAGAPFGSLAGIGATQSAKLNWDMNAMNWLKGNEIATPAGFRSHSVNGLMGDVVNSNLVYVGSQDYGYSQLPVVGNTGAATYAAFVANNASRTPMLFTGANGGMLHGLNAITGSELMAFIPGGVYEEWNDSNKNYVKDSGETEKKLFNLTQINPEHRLFVDGDATAGDAFVGGSWKTYLVGGLGAGGRSVYALDVTDNNFDASDVKWEFSHPELGRTYGKPVIARFPDNKWYAVFPNGPDSTSDVASVFVVNLANPADHHILFTDTGSTLSPNGMMTVQVKFNAQRTATTIYAGDLKGNIWKFDVSAAGSFPEGTRLFSAKDPGGMNQSITGGLVVSDHPHGYGTMVYFGTGKYFETMDGRFSFSSVPQVDSFYGVLDGGAVNLTRSSLQIQIFTTSGGLRTASTNNVNYPAEKGWYIDFTNNGVKKGEKVFTDPVLNDGRIIFSSKVPSDNDHCIANGSGYLNVLDVLSGGQLDERALDTNLDGLINNADTLAASIEMNLLDSAGPLLINSDSADNSYVLLNASLGDISSVAVIHGYDSDNDGVSDFYDSDDDNDGVPDTSDNCRIVVNPDQLNADNDGWLESDYWGGDACDEDDDNDGVLDIMDDLPFDPSDSVDSDNDGVGDNRDNCYGVVNADQTDTDGDWYGNACDTDDDGDGVPDVADTFPVDGYEHADNDNDAIGDNADEDDDNDGVIDYEDVSPLDAAEFLDSDGDHIGNNSDTDDDNDGVPDISDALPLDDSETVDTDGDRIGDNADEDDDNDGVDDWEDVFPLDAAESMDADGDGIGNNADSDDDNDGVEDGADNCPWLSNADQLDADANSVGDACESASDKDGDSIVDEDDNCPLLPNAYQKDYDGDGEGDACDSDDDNDAVPDVADAFPLDIFESIDPDNDRVGNNMDNCDVVANVLQEDSDSDGLGDACDGTPNGDEDGDGVDYLSDNCILVANADQLDSDGDAEGNACDNDDDNDNVADVADAFPLDAAESVDTDSDGIGDNADTTPNGDMDSDGIDNLSDNCVSVSNADQVNFDGDAQGNACDVDNDNDGVLDVADAFPLDADESFDLDADGVGDNGDNCVAVANASQYDADGDAIGDACDSTQNGDVDNDGIGNLVDNCVAVPNVDQLNTDGDIVGNACDKDDDNDGVSDVSDAFPLDANESYDTDGDGVGNNADDDDDNDIVLDVFDALPLNASESVDTDGDGIGDNADTTPNGDTDKDGIDNLSDNCVTFSNANQLNTDGDSKGNVCDIDDDNDGVTDFSDPFPLDASESADTDEDGIGNNADTDDDNDGVVDIFDAFPLDESESVDTDGDGIGDNTDITPNGDADNDDVDNLADNCVTVANADQFDTDADGAGDACDTTPNGDTDSDGIDNLSDNCVSVSNADQLNTDGDSEGNACDSDDDNDNVADASDAFPLDATESVDTDSDGVGNNADNCVAVANASQTDTDSDGAGDVCDNTPNGDTDNDGIDNAADNCPLIANVNQLDHDADGTGDACDEAVPLPEDFIGAANSKAGASVAFAGDVNGDGYGDYIIGMPGYDIPASPPLKAIKNAGRAEVISGNDGAVLMSVNGTAANDAMGTAVTGNADINNDGLADVLVGAPLADSDAKDVGSVTVLFGPDGATSHTLYGEQAKAGFGTALALGDLDNDSYAEMIIGAPAFDDAGSSVKDAGAVMVFDHSNTLIQTHTGVAAKDYFGSSVAVGDINHDGSADVIVGSPNADDGANGLVDAGNVTVLSSVTAEALFTAYGDRAKTLFGTSVVAGDVNHDGFDDVLVGSPGDVNGTLKNAGSIAVFSGSTGVRLTKQFGATVNASHGNSVAVGDVNGDGFADIIAGSWKDDTLHAPFISNAGSVFIRSGNGYRLLGMFYGNAANDYFGAAVSAGDINSDGKADVIIGVPGYTKGAGAVRVLSGAGL